MVIVEDITGAIAETEGTEPENLDIILHNHVSVEAIRELVTHDTDSWRLQFETQDHVVTLTGENTILVDGVLRRTFD